jgi:hypothetical protein
MQITNSLPRHISTESVEWFMGYTGNSMYSAVQDLLWINMACNQNCLTTSKGSLPHQIFLTTSVERFTGYMGKIHLWPYISQALLYVHQYK